MMMMMMRRPVEEAEITFVTVHWPRCLFHSWGYLFPSRYLATRTKLRQRQWQQNITVTGEEDDSNKVRWAPLEGNDGSDVRAGCIEIRVALLWLHLPLIYETIVNFILSYCSIPANMLATRSAAKANEC